MSGPVVLHSERLTLRPAEPGDAGTAFARASQPSFARFLPLPRPYTRAAADAFIQGVIARDWATHPSFTIVLDGAENTASWRVMEKLGMVRERYERSARMLDGEPRDDLVYVITIDNR